MIKMSESSKQEKRRLEIINDVAAVDNSDNG